MKVTQRLLFAVRKKARRRRKPRGARRCVPHREREAVAARHPVHVTMRVAEGLPSLRGKGAFRVVRECLRVAKARLGARVVHFSVMGNHVHLIVEAAGKRVLARAMQGLKIRVAKGLNRTWGRGGTVFAERYHAHVLKTPAEVRNALCYVLNNARKHRLRLAGDLDPCASGAWFDGWKGRRTSPVQVDDEAPVAAPHTWLVLEGWRRARRPIGPTDIPPPRSS
jgi:REP element-mobilizing transposase RayT